MSEFSEKLAKGITNFDRFDSIVNGASDDPDVATDGGDVPPVAKSIAALEAVYEGSGYVTAAEAAQTAAEAAQTAAEAAQADIIANDFQKRQGGLENPGGLLKAFKGFSELEQGTRSDPVRVGVLGFGDSMASATYVFGFVRDALMRRFGVGAWTSPNLGGLSENGAVWSFSGGASEKLEYDLTPGGNWIELPAGGSASYTLPNVNSASANLRGSSQMNSARVNGDANNYHSTPNGISKVSVYYVKESGAGTLEATISQDQIADQVDSVSADAADGMGVLEFTPVNRAGEITVEVEASGAEVNVIGVVFWADSGVVWFSAQVGGSTMESQEASLDAGSFKPAFSEFCEAMDLSLVLHSQRALGDADYENNYTAFFSAFSELNNELVSQLVLSEPPKDPDATSPTVSEINEFLREECESSGIPFLDINKLLGGTYANLEAAGFDVTTLPSTVDSTHLGGLYYRFAAMHILNSCNWFTMPLSIFDPVTNQRAESEARFVKDMLLEGITRKLHYQTGYVPDNQLTSGTGFDIAVSNYSGVLLSSGTAVGYAACNLGVIHGGGPSGSRPYIMLSTNDFAVAIRSTEGFNTQQYVNSWVGFGLIPTSNPPSSVASIGAKCFGVQFGWGADEGSPGGAAAEICRLFAYDGTTLQYGPWVNLDPAGAQAPDVEGLNLVLRWDTARKTFFLYTGREGASTRPLSLSATLTCDALTGNTHGAGVFAGIAAPSSIPLTGGYLSITEITARMGSLGEPFKTIQ